MSESEKELCFELIPFKIELDRSTGDIYLCSPDPMEDEPAKIILTRDMLGPVIDALTRLKTRLENSGDVS